MYQDNYIIILMMGSEMITKKLVAFDELKCLMAREDFINDITSVCTISFRTTHKAFVTIFYLDFIKSLLLLFMSMEWEYVSELRPVLANVGIVP
jgi:hypothetical protein